MKILLTLAFMFFVASAFGQTPDTCDLTINDSPAIRGLKLGMAEADFKRAFTFPMDKGYVSALDLRRLEGFDNVDWIRFEFYKGRLYQFKIRYDDSVDWQNWDEFAKAISEPLKLPLGAWKNLVSDSDAMMGCKEFHVYIDSRARYIELTDELSVKEMEEEQRRKDAEKKRAFKP
jgi:hypothetical protein